MAKPRQGRKVGARKPNRHPVHNSRINFLEYYDEEEQKKACDYFVRQFQAARDFTSDRRARWYEYYQLYRSYSPYYEDRPPWQAGFFVPKTFESVETMKARWVSALFDVPPLWTASATKPEYQQPGKQWEYYLDTRQRAMSFYMTMYETISSLLIYDAAFIKLHYQNDDFYEGVMADPRDIFDIFIDPQARTFDPRFRTRSPRFIVDRDISHIDYLLELQKSGLYSNVDKIKKSDGNRYLCDLDRQQVVGYNARSGNLSEDSKEMHEVLEYWGKWVDNRNEEKPEYFDVVATIVDRQHLVRFEECPYVLPVDGGSYWYAIKPFGMFRNVALPNELYGMGIPEQIRYLQLELNDRRNQIADAAQLSISPVYQYVDGSIEDDDVITFAPGTKIKTFFPNALTPLMRDMNWVSALRETSEIKKEIQDATGITDPIRGQAITPNVKATVHVSQVEEANVRIKLPIELMSQTSLPQIARMIYLMERQFTREEVFVQIMDAGQVKAFMKINPSAVKFEGDFNIQVNSLYGQKGVAAQRRLDIARLAMEMMSANVIQPGSVDFMKLLKLIGDATDIRDKVFLGDEMLAPGTLPGTPTELPSNVMPFPSKRRTVQPEGDLVAKLAKQAGLAGGGGGAPTSAVLPSAATDVDQLAAMLAAQVGLKKD